MAQDENREQKEEDRKSQARRIVGQIAKKKAKQVAGKAVKRVFLRALVYVLSVAAPYIAVIGVVILIVIVVIVAACKVPGLEVVLKAVGAEICSTAGIEATDVGAASGE